ncbi:MAG: Efflux ABC transporter, ATP-binding protein, partial [uncultured Acidimicrobiales bacterium]
DRRRGHRGRRGLQVLRRHRGALRGLVHRRAGHHRAARAERRRQVDVAAHHVRPHSPVTRAGAHPRPGSPPRPRRDPAHRSRAATGGTVRPAHRAAVRGAGRTAAEGRPAPAGGRSRAAPRRARPGRWPAGAHVLEGHAPAGEGGPGSRPLTAGRHARRAPGGPRSSPAAADDRAVPPAGRRGPHGARLEPCARRGGEARLSRPRHRRRPPGCHGRLPPDPRAHGRPAPPAPPGRGQAASSGRRAARCRRGGRCVGAGTRDGHRRHGGRRRLPPCGGRRRSPTGRAPARGRRARRRPRQRVPLPRGPAL